ncbi:MAG: FAD:protein FMN transferase [Oscillospiraceae bacterium]
MVGVMSMSGCASSTVISDDFFAMNTDVSVKCYGRNSKKAIAQLKEDIKKTETLISPFLDNSDIKNINDNAGIKPVHVDKKTYQLINQAVLLCGQSDGNFDITVGPISFLWKDFFESGTMPNSEEISTGLKLINYNDILLNEQEQTVFLTKNGMKLDLGGIAKGYVCTDFAEILDENNILSAMVSIGGNVYTYKQKPDGSRYTLGIRDPKKTANDYMGKLVTTDTVVATSGAYERYKVVNDKVYHHIIDIKTGYPANSDIVSVSVIAKDPGLADFLSTSIYLGGTKKMKEHLNQENYSVIIIDSSNNVYISNALKDDFTITNNEYKLSE